MKIRTMSRGRYALAALSTVTAAAALLAVGGANPFLGIDHSVNHDVDHNKVDPVTCVSVVDVNSSEFQALDLGGHQKEKHPSGSACKDVN